MWISALGLQNFRSYEAAHFRFEPGTTTFLAPNGTGKTNIVEAVGYISSVRSHRSASDEPLVRSGCDSGVISTVAHRGQRHVTVDITIKAKGANRARINRSPVRIRDVLGLIPSVVFSPEDLALVRGEPAGRRDFIDSLLIAMWPRYAGVLADVDKALKQRNALLKAIRTHNDSATLDIWNYAFAQAAAEVIIGRYKLLELLSEPLSEAFQFISSHATHARQKVTTNYVSRLPYKECKTPAEVIDVLMEGMAARASAEIERGSTLLGPQRDDIALSIGSLSAKHYASHGEGWSLALALRLAAFEVLHASESAADAPILILDDVFAELDKGRRHRLAERITTAEQVFITAADAADLPDNLPGKTLQVDGQTGNHGV